MEKELNREKNSRSTIVKKLYNGSEVIMNEMLQLE